MPNSTLHIDPNEQHYSVQQLQDWLAGAGTPEERMAIADHLSNCEMCSDIVEGLLEFDTPEGIRQREGSLFMDFKSNSLYPKKKKALFDNFKMMSPQNTALLYIAIILLVTLIAAMIYMNQRKKYEEQKAQENSYDNSNYFPVQEDSTFESNEYYPVDSDATNQDIQNIVTSGNQLTYRYYNPNERSGHGPNYNYLEDDPLYYTNSSSRSPTGVTQYTSKGQYNNEGYTPENLYFGYDSRNVVESKPKTEKVQIGNQLIDLNKVIDEAQSYYYSDEYEAGIRYLSKYERGLKEPLDDIDYWMAKYYWAMEEKDQAKPYIQRLAGYNNPYQAEAKKLLGQY